MLRTLKWLAERVVPSRSRLLDSDPAADVQTEVTAGTRKRKGWLRRLLDLAHFTGMSTVTSSIGATFSWQTGNNLTGSAYQQVQNAGTIQKTVTMGTSSANSAAGGGDEVFSFQQTISAGSSVTVDLTAMTNLLQQASVSIARVKGMMIRNLSTTDDSTINSPGSRKIFVFNYGAANPSPLWFQSGGTGLSLNLAVNAGNVINAVSLNTNAAIGGGSGYPINTNFMVTPAHNTGSGALIMATTNATGVVTSVTLLTGGSSYTICSVTGVPAGSCLINGGGFQACSDVVAAGFLLVSSSQKNFSVANVDQTNVATMELDFLAATS